MSLDEVSPLGDPATMANRVDNAAQNAADSTPEEVVG